MLRTRITELLGIEHPIVGGCMMHISGPEFVAAISNAGALGMMASAMFTTQDTFRRAVRRAKELTDKPFGVNLSLFPALRPIDNRLYVEVILEEGVKVVETSGHRPPQELLAQLKASGIKTMHKCVSVRHAVSAQKAGVDAVIVSGTEGGGHSGFDQMTTLCLVPQAADAVEIPVIAGGGIVDARGIVAVLALGAEGVYMGTRFMATEECPTHANVKAAILGAMDTGTMAIRHGSPVPREDVKRGDRGFVEERRGSIRLLLNDFAREIIAAQGGNVSFEEVIAATDSAEENPESNRTVAAFLDGNLDRNTITASQGSGLIRDVPTCQDLINRLMAEAGPVLDRLTTAYSSS